MLPFRKKQDDGGVAGPVEVKERKPDTPDEFGMLDAVAEDILMAIEKKDATMLKEALSSLVAHIQMADAEQDGAMP